MWLQTSVATSHHSATSGGTLAHCGWDTVSGQPKCWCLLQADQAFSCDLNILSDNGLSLGCSCGWWGRCGCCNRPRVCCFWKESSSLWKRGRGFSHLFGQTLLVFHFCLTRLFSETPRSDENKSSQVLSGASGANTGHFASFFYYTRYNFIAIVIVIVIIIIYITIIRIYWYIDISTFCHSSIRARALLEGQLAAEARITLFSLQTIIANVSFSFLCLYTFDWQDCWTKSCRLEKSTESGWMGSLLCHDWTQVGKLSGCHFSLSFVFSEWRIWRYTWWKSLVFKQNLYLLRDPLSWPQPQWCSRGGRGRCHWNLAVSCQRSCPWGIGGERKENAPSVSSAQGETDFTCRSIRTRAKHLPGWGGRGPGGHQWGYGRDQLIWHKMRDNDNQLTRSTHGSLPSPMYGQLRRRVLSWEPIARFLNSYFSYSIFGRW